MSDASTATSAFAGAITKVAFCGVILVLLAGQTTSDPSRRAPKSDQAVVGPAKNTMNWASALMERLRSCWYVHASLRNARPLQVRISFDLRRDGTLAGPPSQVPTSDGDPSLVQSAIQAVEKCQPYSFLPQSEYVGGWDRLDVTFDTGKAPTTVGVPTSIETLNQGEIPKSLQIMQPERKR
jgi:hypothetical protein